MFYNIKNSILTLLLIIISITTINLTANDKSKENKNIPIMPRIDTYLQYDNKTIKSFVQNKLFSLKEDGTRTSVYNQLWDKGFQSRWKNNKSTFLKILNKKSPKNIKVLFHSGINTSSSITKVSIKKQYIIVLGLNRDPNALSNFNNSIPPLYSGTHEIEHTCQHTPIEIKNHIIRYNKKHNIRSNNQSIEPVVKASVELPAVLNELAYLSKRAKEQIGKKAISNINVPLKNEEGVTLLYIHNQFKENNFFNNNKSMTEIVNTEKWQSWIRYWLDKHKNKNSE